MARWRSWRSIAVALVAVGFVGACSAPVAPTPSGAGQTESFPTVVRVAYSCGGDMTFDLAALAGVPAPGAAAAALRAHLAEPVADIALPDEGWRAVAVQPDAVTYLAPTAANAETPYAYADAALEGGAWQVVGYGDCRPTAVVDDAPAAEWTLAAPVGEADRTLTLLVTERSCASGHTPEGRILDPAVKYEAEAIQIIIPVRPREGGQDCQGVPSVQHVIELAEAVNGRRLYDAGTLPPIQR